MHASYSILYSLLIETHAYKDVFKYIPSNMVVTVLVGNATLEERKKWFTAATGTIYV